MTNSSAPTLMQQLRAAVSVSAALLIGLAIRDATPLEAATGQELDAANQAYHEVASKNFVAAIQDFRKALAADPSNLQLREDLAYAYVAAGSLREAGGEFENVYRDHPENSRIALELGYLLQQLHHDDAALRYFEAAGRSADPTVSDPARQAAANLRASQQQDRKQRAYDLIAQGNRAEAIRLFEAVREDDPTDDAATMQLGYLYAASGQMTQARQLFTLERSNPNSQVASQAAYALNQVNQDSKAWFSSFYAAPFYQSRFANQIDPVNAKVGLRLDRDFQPYLGLRFNRDLRSRSGALPEIFSDNSAVFSLGVQSSVLGKGAILYAEAGTAVSLLSQPTHGRAVPDYRAGVTWFRSWGTSFTQAAVKDDHGFSLSGSAYSDVSFYSRFNHNAIGYVQLREGLNLPTSRLVPIQVLVAANFVKDSNGNFYNNVLEVGPGLKIGPFPGLPSVRVEAEYLRGAYVVHDGTNAYGPHYGDARVFLIWSKSF